MIKALFTLLLALPLLSLAPAPPTIYHTTVAIVQAAHQPGCTWETAPARLRQQISDPYGWPYGEVAAWSCSGNSQAVIAELQARASAMRAEAAAYRAAHPIANTAVTP